MAGIGWRLERLIDRGVCGAVAAHATGAAVMCLPWVLTTAALASLSAILGRTVADFGAAQTIVNVACAVAMLVAGPVQIVISRFAADRLYEEQLHAIAAPFCRGLGTTFLICAAPTALALLALHLPLHFALWGAVLSAAVGAQWTALSVGNGLCTPALVLGAVAAGSGLGFLAAALLAAVVGLGVPGYLFGLISGQILSLVILLVGVLRALPEEASDRVKLLPAFRDYATLAGAGLAFNASLWIDKPLAWCLAGRESASLHGLASTMAWLSTVPCLAWIFVEMETSFHRRFRTFFRSLEGGASLAELHEGVLTLKEEAARLLCGALSLQAGLAALLGLCADSWTRWLNLPPEAVTPYRLLLAGTTAQALGLLGLTLLYYLDLRGEACLAAAGLLLAITGSTVAASALGLPPSVGTALGSSLGAVLIWHSVFRGVGSVLQHTLLSQPFGVERMPTRRGGRKTSGRPRPS